MDVLIVPRQYCAAHAEGLAHCLATGEGLVLEQRVRVTLDRAGAKYPVELSILPAYCALIRSLGAGLSSHLIRLMVQGRLGGGFRRGIDADGYRIAMRLPRACIKLQDS